MSATKKINTYRFYRSADEDKLLHVWDHKPTIKEINEAIGDLAASEGFDRCPYLRIWSGGEDNEYTIFDFGSWSVFGKIEPSVYDLYVKSAELGTYGGE